MERADDGPEVSGELLFVTAPVSRCGTTLVQRLLNSDPGVLVFGEGVGAALVELARALQEQARAHLPRAETYRRDLERALAGEQFWCPHLLGDARGFVELFASALERFVEHHAAEARAHGRARFGAKLPTVSPEELRDLRRSLPGARVIYVTRGLLAAARSAKARRFLDTPESYATFARLWRSGMQAADELGREPDVLVLRYESLVGESERVLAELAAFAGVRALDPAVLRARVNTWSGPPEKGHAPDQRLAPGDLSPREREILLSGAVE